MKILNLAGRVFTNIFKPIKGNAAFFVFMYVLGIVCTYAVVPDKRGYHAWPLAPYELFFDVSIICVVLWLLPRSVAKWLKRFIYVFFYMIVLVDVYCFVKFDTTITPTMLLLVGETDSREAAEFLESYLTGSVVFSRLGWVLLVLLAHVAWVLIWHNRPKCKAWLEAKTGMALGVPGWWRMAEPWLGLLFLVMFVVSTVKCFADKTAFVRLMSYDNIGQVEHELTKKEKAQLYLPGYRLVFSIYANELTAKQVKTLVENIDKAKVDSCSFRSKNIVLIIGESYNRHHAGLYGYHKDTTPRQEARAQKGELIPFSDVVAPWNLTSFVFKALFSLYTVGDKGEWCDYPLFPELFRKAGYHVTFLTNQFLPQAKEAVYDFSGGFFLNNPQLSHAMFDTRNTRLYRYDDGLLGDYDRLQRNNGENNLIIFHLKGQHVDYRTRFPRDRRHFNPEDYDRPELKQKELRVLADYDNAILYNDSIVDQIIKRFEDEDAIVVYVPDHGEECYEGDVHFYGRMHSTEITARLAREEFDIPFWIWCSHSFMVGHPALFNDIVKAKNRRYMTDALPHLLLYLGGISSPHYRDDLNVLSDGYNEKRPRMLKNTTDYDKLGVED
ncbi:arylsulfatase [Prevotella sp. CAG:255]|uniref:sulfatase-like hydrolase/transferase n=1 Tax=Prevotella sp. CAG:255 TaxID=1262923 RepID=UPI00033E1A5F|nr:phosphoethanolamine transferase [Prevotella sp. CAG:255]CCX68700.1 arylsulfatase [Prevotella sp. CAG:255]